MEQSHDTFTDLSLGTPVWFTLSACALPLGLLTQFLSAGSALFRDQTLWGLHGTIGGALSIPIMTLLAGAVLVPRLRGFGWWAGLICLLFLTQIGLAAGGGPLPLSLHPMNGALLLVASVVLLAKIERRRAQPLPGRSLS
ncbi:DUF6220 domain-containing protein [Loktanella sp. DJP18]|uniref:DUF6220 domain-containing protein n=1 Tax=Loktanella sp. DJP18 TaxID=3409788 RepID=UPI003BB4A551